MSRIAADPIKGFKERVTRAKQAEVRRQLHRMLDGCLDKIFSKPTEQYRNAIATPPAPLVDLFSIAVHWEVRLPPGAPDAE